MPDPTSEATRINYAQQDANARRLWDTQRGKANPWEHRGRQLDGEEATDTPPPKGEEAIAGEPPASVMIAQQDRLRLQPAAKAVENPFESLIEHQLHLKLNDQPSP